MSPLALLFVHPMQVPQSWRLLLFPPLVLCIALVYRVTRARRATELPRSTVLTFVNITLGMGVIAVGFLLLHELVRRMA